VDVRAFRRCSDFLALVYFMAVALYGSEVEKLFRLGAICFRSYWMQGPHCAVQNSSASGSYRQADMALVV
jgi:hypothetical protein